MARQAECAAPHVLVTGAAGYLGHEIVEALARRRARVSGCDRIAADGVEACDLGVPGAAHALIDRVAPDVVVHAAALLPRSRADYDDEAQGAANLALVDAVIAARPARVVFISSMTVYSALTPGPVAEEDAVPRSAYARAKLEGEHRFAAAGLPWCAARLPGLFGGRRKGGLVGNLSACAIDGREPTLPAAPLVWAALHVADAADGVARLALNGAAQGPVNLGYPGPLSVNRLLDAIAAASGRRFSCALAHPDFEMRLERARAYGADCRIPFDARLVALIDELRQERARP